MHLCYMDESGTSTVPGSTSHFVLVGVSIPIRYWHQADREISQVLGRYGLAGREFHTAWILRKYLEQSRIPNFDNLSWNARRVEVERQRNSYLLRLQQSQQSKTYRQVKKNFRNSHDYIHLTSSERVSLVRDVASCVSNWGYARLFAECINKIHFDSARTGRTIDEQAFEQIVSRFERYLTNIGPTPGQEVFGLLVHDNNETVSRKHTNLMRQFHAQGTLWTRIERIIETPLFVDSSLTSMVQMADLCSYALRRYVENGETDLFHRVFTRADRIGDTAVGVRHFTDNSCMCEICQAHRQS